MSDKENDLERVDAAINLLSEHFDAVQIFASRHEPETEDGTVSVEKGSGNWFTRYGQVSDWMIKVDEDTRENRRGV